MFSRELVSVLSQAGVGWSDLLFLSGLFLILLLIVRRTL